MVQAAVSSLAAFTSDVIDYFPPGIIILVCAAFIANGAFVRSFRHEFVGTLLMIACTFSAGKWIGQESVRLAWTSHFLGVIIADYFGGGPHVNPAVTMSMWTLGKVSYTEAYVRVAGQMAGGLVAFPLCHAIANHFKWVPFGGPEFNMDNDKYGVENAFLSEFFATFLLCILIYTVNWEMNFGNYHYLIKQSLTAIGIRCLIQFFPTAGPAMNPMLATSWAAFGVGSTFEFPKEISHYFVYWMGPYAAAVLASIAYVIYAGGTIFGNKLPLGPLKPVGSKNLKKD